MQRDAVDELAALSGSSQGWIRFAAPELLGQQLLPAVLASFSQQYPQVTLDVQFSDQALDPLQGKFDFVIRGAFPQSSELIGYPFGPIGATCTPAPITWPATACPSILRHCMGTP